MTVALLLGSESLRRDIRRDLSRTFNAFFRIYDR